MLRFHFNYIAPFYLVSVRFAFCFFLFASASSAGKELNQPNCCKNNQKTDPGGDSAKKMTKKKEKKKKHNTEKWETIRSSFLLGLLLMLDATESRVQFRFRFQFRVVFFGLLMIIVIFFVDYRCDMSWVRLSSVWLSWVGLSWAQLNWVGLGFGLGLVEKYLVGLCFVESVCSAFLFGCRCSGSDKYEKKTLWSFWSINK